MEIYPDHPDMRMYLAMLLQKVGEAGQAESVVRPLAPTDRPGYPQAHYWMAQTIMGDPARVRARWPEAEAHLLRFIQGETGESAKNQGRVRLGMLYSLIGRYREARPLLKAASVDDAAQLLALARTYRGLDETEEADGNARAALRVARGRTEKNPDDLASRLMWADACLLLKDYAGATEALEPGLVLGNEKALRPKLAAVCVAWSTEMARRSASANDPAEAKELLGKRLAKIEQGLRYDPMNPSLMRLIGGLMEGGGAGAEATRAMLREWLVAGKSPVLVHLCLGNDAFAGGRVEEARGHLEQAYRLDPTYTLTANSLAYILASREPTDLPRALALIDQAVTAMPGQAFLHGTRGQILVKLKRWNEAAAELEVALANGQDGAGIHSALAEAYDHLNLPEIAAAHRKAAK